MEDVESHRIRPTTSYRRKSQRNFMNIDSLPAKLKLKGLLVKSFEKSGQINEGCIQVRCKDERNNLFQMYLRAGIKDRIDNFLEFGELDTLKSEFYIDMMLKKTRKNKEAECVTIGSLRSKDPDEKDVGDTEEIVENSENIDSLQNLQNEFTKTTTK